MTVSFSNGEWIARDGQDFVVSHSARSAEAKLRRTIRKGRTFTPHYARPQCSIVSLVGAQKNATRQAIAFTNRVRASIK